ncbi:creatinine amidohydrolase [Paenibacillus baekrokdamisoli]|uniref:Creatinine amidohydrolase n=1 Tax=Paenibacillus baekrokdamisoli TaxID=1712516 RepID=A0A3G9ITS0_9BACL|nr:creatininase family protein [Paenibacillus baekrokdamisoli]MBB3067369.1 creatinine amidohydrolase [Paenibacillus baekrokdamisoli]BBH19445.1 creatinine amidohydrolase [Paenibacillus baekrokdamisoli]
MQWENLTTKQFEEAVLSTNRVCVLPIGCLEKHGDHLPLGTDMMIARAVTEQAAKLEPYVIFPYYLFGQVSEVKHWAGTVAINSSMQMMLLNEVVKEIRRNGFDKIILANAHGGNNNCLRYFVQTMLDERRDYIVYTYDLWELTPEQLQHLEDHFETPGNYGHADHMETSQILHIDPNLVQMDKLNPGEWDPLGRGGWMTEEKLSAGIHWYTEYPNQIAGDPSLSSAEYGKTYIEFCAANFAKAVKRVKQDDTALQLQKEFFDRCDDVSTIG